MNHKIDIMKKLYTNFRKITIYQNWEKEIDMNSSICIKEIDSLSQTFKGKLQAQIHSNILTFILNTVFP